MIVIGGAGVWPGQSGVPGHTNTERGTDVRPGKSGVPGLMVVIGGAGVWPGESGAPGHTDFCPGHRIRSGRRSAGSHSGSESSMRCARAISTGTALPSWSKPSPTVLRCKNLALIPSSTTASLKQPKAM